MKTCKYDPEMSLYGMVTGLWQGLESSDDSVVFMCVETVDSPEGPSRAIIEGSRPRAFFRKQERGGACRNNKKSSIPRFHGDKHVKPLCGAEARLPTARYGTPIRFVRKGIKK